MSADRRKRGVWALIIDDPYRKMVAIGLAVLLWFFIDSRIMDSWTFTLQLNDGDQMSEQGSKRDSSEFVVFLPSGVQKTRFLDGDVEIMSVDVKMSGPRYKIEGFKNDPLRLKVMTLLGRQWRNRDVGSEGDAAVNDSDIEIVEITAADLEKDIRYDDIRIELIPARIRIEVRITDTYTWELVTPDMVEFVTTGDRSRMRTDKATFSPPGITLGGPVRVLRSLEERTKRFRAEFKFGPRDSTATATLEVIDGVKDVYPEGIVPQVTIPLNAERKSYTLSLPLGVCDKRADSETTRYECDEKSLPVSVSFSGGLGRLMQGRSAKDRQGWAAQYLRLEVYLRDPASGVPLGPELSLEPWILLDGTLKHLYPNNEYRLDASETVTVRAKK